MIVNEEIRDDEVNLEEIRIDEVKRFLQLDFNRISEFQTLVDLAGQLCETPVALMTLLGKENNYLKVRYGVDVEVMPRETSFCQYALKQDDLLIIPDAAEDPRFDDNPLVISGPKVRFYAGAPLILSNGLKLGTLCLFDLKPNNLNDIQRNVLTLLSRQAVSFMELELSRIELKKQIDEKDDKNQSLIKIAQLQSHQIRQPLTSIMGLVSLVKDGYQEVNEEWLKLFETATERFDTIIQTIVAETLAEKDVKAIRFNKMVEEIDDCAILLLDNHGYIENWNKGAKKIKGYKSREIVGKHFSVFYTDYDKENKRPQQLLAEAEEKGVAKDEGWRVRKNGDKFWGSVVITAIHDQQHNVIGFTKLTRDLTDITDTRESLKASGELYKHLLAQTNKVARVGGWELDLVKNELTWTAVTKEIHGVDADYVPELSSAINFYKEGDSRNKMSELVAKSIAEGGSWDVELQIVTQQEKEVWIRATGSSNYKDGVCTRVYGTFQDINISKTAEINSLRSGKILKDVLNAVSEVSIMATDADGLITIFNSGAEKMLRYKADEVIGVFNFCSFFSESHIEKREVELTQEYGYAIKGFDVFIKHVQKNGVEQKHWVMRGKNGLERNVTLIVTPMKNSDDNSIIDGYLGIVTIIL